MESQCACKTLFVGNLHASIEENDLLNIFKPFGTVVECCKKVTKKNNIRIRYLLEYVLIIFPIQKWPHYGFIQFATDAEAKLARDNLNSSKLRGRSMRIEYQRKKVITSRHHIFYSRMDFKISLESKASSQSKRF